MIPPTADAPAAPSLQQLSTQTDRASGQGPASAAQQYEMPKVGRDKRKQEQDDWFERNLGGPNPYGDAMRKDRLDMSNDLLTDEQRKKAGTYGAFTGLKGTNRFMK